MNIGNFEIGNGRCFIVAELGINHNGSIEIAKKLIDAAKNAGADAVKFQKRTVEKVYTKEDVGNKILSHNWSESDWVLNQYLLLHRS